MECCARHQIIFFSNVSLSGITVTRNIEELAGDIENSLKEFASKFVYYSVVLDETTDMTDTVYTAIFIRRIDDSFLITEEMAALLPMKGTRIQSETEKLFMINGKRALRLFERCEKNNWPFN